MRNRVFEEELMMSNMSEKAIREYYESSEDRKRKMLDETMLSYQTEKLWNEDLGISQLEGRIETDNFQGQERGI